MWFGSPRVFFCLPPVHLHIIPHCLCNHNHAQPCRQEIIKPRSRIACCYAQDPSRIVLPSSHTYCKHLHSYPPIPSLSPCFSVIHHRWALHHAATAPEKKLTGLAGLRSVLWSRSRRLFWPARPARASGRPLDEGEIDQASWGWHCCAARTFAVLQCRCPHVLSLSPISCCVAMTATHLRRDCCLYTHLTVLCQVPQERGVLSSAWHLFCLERCVLLDVKTGLTMQSSQGHDVPPVGHPYVSVFVSC